SIHHIATDGWSQRIVFEEAAAFYLGRAPVEDLPIQYADFARWQRRWLVGAELERQLAYWRQQLADAPEVLELPLDHPRGAVGSGPGAVVGLDLPDHLARRLRAFVASEGATLHITLLAMFQALLGRLG